MRLSWNLWFLFWLINKMCLFFSKNSKVPLFAVTAFVWFLMLCPWLLPVVYWRYRCLCRALMELNTFLLPPHRCKLDHLSHYISDHLKGSFLSECTIGSYHLLNLVWKPVWSLDPLCICNVHCTVRVFLNK